MVLSTGQELQEMSCAEENWHASGLSMANIHGLTSEPSRRGDVSMTPPSSNTDSHRTQLRHLRPAWLLEGAPT